MIVKNQSTLIFTCAMQWHYDWNYTSNHNIVVNVISILIWIFSITLYTVGEDNTDSLTGWFNSVFDTLLGYYNKYTIHTEKSVVDFFSVHRDISFHNNKLEKITVHTVKIWIGNLMWFLPQNSTYNFEAVWGQ